MEIFSGIGEIGLSRVRSGKYQISLIEAFDSYYNRLNGKKVSQKVSHETNIEATIAVKHRDNTDTKRSAIIANHHRKPSGQRIARSQTEFNNPDSPKTLR
ncbi:hypothetical protein ABIC09_003956 [Bradyrhizobium sp. S3.12.5]|uniref:hypothetical protein n=1 Tax=Bradyrhizobium sp. S3.12.5 TaxID=3156386 RepID=UPI003390DFF5